MVLLAPCATRQSHGVMPNALSTCSQGAPPKAPRHYVRSCVQPELCTRSAWVAQGVLLVQAGCHSVRARGWLWPPPHTAQLRFRFAQGWFQVSVLPFARWAPAGVVGPQGCRGSRGGGKVLCSGQDVVEEGMGRRAMLYGDPQVPV